MTFELFQWSAQQWLHELPKINASFNGAAGTLMLLGFAFIKLPRPRYRVHGTLMLGALVCSAAFLTCYLSYIYLHYQLKAPLNRFPPGFWRPIYLTILITHMTLAMVILPLIALTVYRAARRDWARHRRIAAITFPLWLYVSVTGVAIYFMLYPFAAHLRSMP